MYGYRFPDIFGETWHIGIDCIHFSKKTNLDISLELSVTIHMKYQDSFFFFFVCLFVLKGCSISSDN